MQMSEGTALTHLHYSVNINALAKQFYIVFPAEWFANRMAKDRGAAAPSIFCAAKPNLKTPVKTSLFIDSPLVEHVGNFSSWHDKWYSSHY